MKNLIIVALFMSLSPFTFAQTLPNQVFESWVNYGIYEDPELWSTPNQALLLFQDFTVLKSNIAFSGNYSAKLETKTFLGSVDVPGLITLAQININPFTQDYSLSGGLALQENVSKFSGMYQYQGVEGDSATVLIYNFKRDNENNMDTIGFGVSYLHNAVSWTPFTVNMENLNYHVPDTFNVIIISSGQEFHAGSVLLVDSLTIETNTGIINLSDNQLDVSVYPNPTSDYVNFETSKIEKQRQISIYDIAGNLINTYEFSDGKIKISTKELPSGLYTFRVTIRNITLAGGSFIKN